MDLIINKPMFNEDLEGKKIKIVTKDGKIEYATIRGYRIFDPFTLSLASYSTNSRNLLYLKSYLNNEFTIEIIHEFPTDIEKHHMHDHYIKQL